MSLTRWLALPLAVVLCIPAFAQDTKSTLGWKLKKGDKVRYAYTYDFNRQMQMDNMSQLLTLHVTQEVTEAGESGASITAKIDRVVAKLNFGFLGSFAYDSDAGADKPKTPAKDDEEDDAPAAKASPLSPLGCIVGESFSFKLARDGSVSELAGMEKLIMKLSEKANLPKEGAQPDFSNPQALVKMVALPMFIFVFSPELMSGMLDIHCHLFSKDGTGESVTLDSVQNLPQTGELSFKRTVTNKGEGEALGVKGVKFEQTGTKPEFKAMKLPPGMGGNNPMAQMAAMMGNQKLKEAKFSGTSVFSPEGHLIKDELVEQLTTEVTLNMGGFPKKKAPADDDDDDDDMPKKKDEKKTQPKKEEKKADDDDDAPAGGMKLIQTFTIKLRAEHLTGETKTAPKSEPKTEPKKEKKESF